MYLNRIIFRGEIYFTNVEANQTILISIITLTLARASQNEERILKASNFIFLFLFVIFFYPVSSIFVLADKRFDVRIK